MKIRISKNGDELIGALRVPKDVFDKLDKLAKQSKVSKQVVIRAILLEVIDTIEL